MTKIELRKEKRYFAVDDSDFSIQVPEEKELHEKYLRSYSIKHALFHGDFKITEGHFLFKFKAAMVYVAKEMLYAKEYGNYFMKDLELDTITYIAPDQVPAKIKVLIDGDEPVIKDEIKIENKTPEVSEGAELSAEVPEEVPEEVPIAEQDESKPELKPGEEVPKEVKVEKPKKETRKSKSKKSK